jgi:hypothetical protein
MEPKFKAIVGILLVSVLSLSQILSSSAPRYFASEIESWENTLGFAPVVETRGDDPRQLPSSVTNVVTSSSVSNGTPTSQTSTPSSFAIFYHIFIPEENAGILNALRIVKEQIQQIGESYAARSSQENNQPLSVFYTTVGNQAGLKKEWMVDLCKNQIQFPVECIHMQHYDHAFEEVTLKRLHQYCGIHPTHRAVYIHSKGSFTRNRPNEGWRKHMTKAVTDERCLNPPNASCNACGLIFFIMPAFMFRGNMWTAKCDYIKQLHTPGAVWEERLEKVFNVAHELHNASRLNFKIQVDIVRRASFGLDRYANEHWVGAHPSVIPCDLSGGKLDMSRVWLRWKGTNGSEFKFNMAPSQPILSNWMWQDRRELRVAIREPKVGWRAFFLLPGRIIQWVEFYNQTPSSDSWVWTWFPHGTMWKEAVDKYGGPGAVDAVAKQLGPH